MFRLAGIIFIMLVSFNAHALNPGESAEDCVEVSANDSGDKIIFKNTCHEKIFVLWCGASDCGRGSKKGGDAGFYTETLNLDAGARGEFNGRADGVHYAACKGTLTAGKPKDYTDDANGGFNCTSAGAKPEQAKNGNSSNATIGLKRDTSAAEKAAWEKALAESKESNKKENAERAKKKLASEKKQAEEKQAKADADAKLKAQIPAKCVNETIDTGNAYLEADARAQAQSRAESIVKGVQLGGGHNRIISINISCKKEATQINPQYLCTAKTKYEFDNISRSSCGGSGPSAPSAATSK